MLASQDTVIVEAFRKIVIVLGCCCIAIDRSWMINRSKSRNVERSRLVYFI